MDVIQRVVWRGLSELQHTLFEAFGWHRQQSPGCSRNQLSEVRPLRSAAEGKRFLADLLSSQLDDQTFCFCGDKQRNTARSWAVAL